MKKKRKNVLLIIADQWRGDTLGCLSHPLVKTPNLDQLAEEGVLFGNHFAQAVPCGPSRASLFTGLYAMNHRSVNNGTPLNSRFTNIALEVRKSGYEPTLFGYTDTSADPRELNASDPLLKTYEGLIPGMTSGVTLTDNKRAWIAELISRGYCKSLNEDTVYDPVKKYTKAEKHGVTFSPTIYSEEDSSTAFLTDELLKWLSVREDENWFAHISFLHPHPPWIAPEPYNSMYDPNDIMMPVRRAHLNQECEQHPLLKMLLQLIPGKKFFSDTYEGLAAETSDKDILQARATYYGLISEIDHHLGRIIKYLKKTGQYDSTLIIFTSDHGEQLGDHFLFGKTGYFDASYAIPLIIRDPEVADSNLKKSPPLGNKIEEFTESIDLMPTILDWLDLEIPEELDGYSLLPFLSGEARNIWRKEVHWEFDFRGIGSYQTMIEKQLRLSPDQCSLTVIRDESYKYVHMTALPPLLFDLKKDPNEFINYAENQDYKHIVLDYSQKMLSWSMLHRDRTLVNINMESGSLIHWKGSRIFV